MITSPLLSNVRQKAMITPVLPLLTALVHISLSYWTVYSSFEIILEMETIHWIGLHIQCFISGVGKLLSGRVFYRKPKTPASGKISL